MLENQLNVYNERVKEEKKIFHEKCIVHDLPDIFHYWSNLYLKPNLVELGIDDIISLFSDKICELTRHQNIVNIASLGSGDCEFEFSILLKLIGFKIRNFNICCYEINSDLISKAEKKSHELGVSEYIKFQCCDINQIKFDKKFDIFMANHSLHHFVELEKIFENIKSNMSECGYFIVNDMIGRNGHMRWPEAYDYICLLWSLLPDSYKWNHQLNRFEAEYINWDCSKKCFEGIRAQDILPLLIKYFDFELFYAFGNIIDIFVDRGFGHNFSREIPFDRAFINFVAELDQMLINEGVVKPIHLIACMVLPQENHKKPKIIRDLTPERCVRKP